MAAIVGFFFAQGPALEVTKQLTQEYPHTAAALVSLAVAVLAYWVGLRAMRKLPGHATYGPAVGGGAPSIPVPTDPPPEASP